MKRSKRAFTVQTKKILWTDETRMEKIMAEELNWLVIQAYLSKMVEVLWHKYVWLPAELRTDVLTADKGNRMKCTGLYS